MQLKIIKDICPTPERRVYVDMDGLLPYFEKRFMLCHHKDMLCGDFLIDDRDKHSSSEFQCEGIPFNSPVFSGWQITQVYLASSI